MSGEEKKKKYASLLPQVEALIDGVDNRVGALANVAALLKAAFDYYFWVGFYVVRHGELQLGPFQGSVACYAIGRGKGVCGTAWAEERSIVVPDVCQFEGHIACSSLSRSEVVVPIKSGGEVVGVIDVDSSETASFDEYDRLGLEQVAVVVGRLFATSRHACRRCRR